MSSRRLAGIQYLRAVAAIAVASFHATVGSAHVFVIGQGGVDLFFVISGFLMIAIMREDMSPIAFLRDRIERIVPPYWLVTTALVVGAAVGVVGSHSSGVGHIAGSYLFVPVQDAGGHYWPVLVQGWTLNLEMAFYALFACLLLLRRPWAIACGMTLVLGALVLLGRLTDAEGAFSFYQAPLILEFAFGTWLGVIWRRGARARWLWLAVAGFAALTLATGLAGMQSRLVTLGLPSAALMAAVLALEAQGRMPRWALLERLGDASYAIYLWHLVGLSFATRIFGKLLGGGDIPTILLVVASVGAGVAMYYLTERPMMRWLKQHRIARSAQDDAADGTKRGDIRPDIA